MADCRWSRRVRRPADQATPGTLDFGGLADVILVGNGSLLAFSNLVLQGIPEAVNASTTGYVVPDLALWPSVSAEPGALVMNHSSICDAPPPLAAEPSSC